MGHQTLEGEEGLSSRAFGGSQCLDLGFWLPELEGNTVLLWEASQSVKLCFRSLRILTQEGSSLGS